jgi:hypothetical protein
MKLFLAITFSLLFGSNILAQTENAFNPALSAVVGIEEIYLAKDDGSGQAGEVAENFLTTDVPIYCVVMLDSVKPATVRMNFIAVSVKGVKPETKVFTTSYKTDGRQDRVNFTGKPDRFWVAGNYRIDVYIDEKLAGKQSFEIRTAAPQNNQTPVAEAQNFVPPKGKAAAKNVRRPRKN